jgi:hypothetical protein
VNRRDFIALGDYQNAAASIYNQAWIPSLGEVLAWGWRQMGFGGIQVGTIPKGKWVLKENLEVFLPDRLCSPRMHTNKIH